MGTFGHFIGDTFGHLTGCSLDEDLPRRDEAKGRKEGVDASWKGSCK